MSHDVHAGSVAGEQIVEANDAVERPGTRYPGARSFFRKVSRFYPFTFAGTLLFLICFFLFGRSIVAKNAYGVILSFLGLFFLIILAGLGRLQAQRLHRGEVAWDVGRPLFARLPGQFHELQFDGPDPLLFFRIHVRLHGRFRISERTTLSLFRDVASDRASEVRLPLVFPLCGSADATAFFYTGDLFGLTRSRFGRKRQFSLTVQPAPLIGSEVPPIQATGGDRETSKTKQPDEERYYMREYVPGDRFRDINWKASSRLTELYTRTSPVTQEQTQLITVYFRHFIPETGRRETVEQIVHLNYAKSWLIAYLFAVKQEHPEFHFRILTGRGEAILESDSDIDALSRSISDLYMTTEPLYFGSGADGSGSPEASGGNEGGRRKDVDSTVFSTAYDEALMAFLQARIGGGATIYRTALSRAPVRRAPLVNPGQVFRPNGAGAQDTGQANGTGELDRAVHFAAFSPGFFPVVSSFLPLRLPPLKDSNRSTAAVAYGGNIHMVERTLTVDL